MALPMTVLNPAEPDVPGLVVIDLTWDDRDDYDDGGPDFT
jgi:hypothetical protein